MQEFSVLGQAILDALETSLYESHSEQALADRLIGPTIVASVKLTGFEVIKQLFVLGYLDADQAIRLVAKVNSI